MSGYSRAVPYDTWAEVAETRILRILARERVMTQHMFESKISESGPVDQDPDADAGEPSKSNQRAEPPHVSSSVRDLEDRGVLRRLPKAQAAARGFTHNVALFVDETFNIAAPSPSDEARLQRVIDGYAAWDSAASKTPLCGGVLENVVHAAALAAGPVTVVGDPGNDPHIPVNDTPLPESPADHVLGIGNELVLVEDKNRRSWIYPSRTEVWTLLHRCLETDCALPVLVARKVPPSVLSFFKLIGALAFQTNNQLFAAHLAPDVHAPFRLVVAKAGLNFHDIRFADSGAATALEERLTRFFKYTVAGEITARRALFREVAPILEYYADTYYKKGLPPDAYQECLTALKSGELPGDFEPDYDDYEPF